MAAKPNGKCLAKYLSCVRKEGCAMRRHLLLVLVPTAIALLSSAFAVAYEPGGPVLFALEGTFIQDTVYTYVITAEPEEFPADVSVTTTVPTSRTWQYRRSQEISDLSQDWAPTPDSISQDDDAMGNLWSTATWVGVSEVVESLTQVRCREETVFEPILTWSNSYPVDPRSFWGKEHWLEPDGFVQSDAPEIRELAETLTEGARLQIEVVGRILAWVHENTRMPECDEPVDRVDAIGVLESGVANCVGFANLSVALIRAAGLPAVSVTGVVADVEEPETAHAWISVYFTDLGWFEFESSSWMPRFGEVPQTILTPQHITLDVGEERGISITDFFEQHTCSIDVSQKPRELQFVDAEVEPGSAVTWVISLRSPCYYEIYEWEYGWRDLPISLSLDGIPTGWYASLSATEVVIPKQGAGSSPVRSLLLTVRPYSGARVGMQGVITVTARDEGRPGRPVIGVLIAAVTTS